ncbi:MAG TPA: hypothetical protein PLQ13_05020 [Candidatus Krumholzibacteria bacterium]|nr:hypothetical protein [Candidatus Krumholzibacteria bacterium]
MKDLIIRINDTPLAVGAPLPAEAHTRAGLRRPPLWRRFGRRGPLRGRRLDVDNCTLEVFDGSFRVYPCLDKYLDEDRQWRTAVSVFVEKGIVRTVMVRVMEAKYAAVEFAGRFQDACTARWGEGHSVDRYTRSWRNGRTTCLSCVEPDRRHATFVIETID